MTGGLAQPGYRTKAEIAAETIRQAIYAGRFAPGTRLVLRRLEVDLGLSMTPIREALQLLQSEGLITQEPHRGFRVASFDAESIDDTYWLRSILEPLATRLATPLLSDSEVEQLVASSEAMTRAIEAGEPRRMQEENLRFHMLIYSAAGRPRLFEHIRLLWRQSPYGSLRVVRERPKRSIAEHQAVLDAIRRRDGDAAERAMHAHIEHARVGLLAGLAAARAAPPEPGS